MIRLLKIHTGSCAWKCMAKWWSWANRHTINSLVINNWVMEETDLSLSWEHNVKVKWWWSCSADWQPKNPNQKLLIIQSRWWGRLKNKGNGADSHACRLAIHKIRIQADTQGDDAWKEQLQVPSNDDKLPLSFNWSMWSHWSCENEVLDGKE